MFNYKSFLTLLLILLPLSAKKSTSIEGVWITQTYNSEKVENGVAVFTKDSLVTYNNDEEDTRTNYSLSGDTIVIEGKSGFVKISGDTLTLKTLNYRREYDTFIFKRFYQRKLSKQSRKLLKKIQGEWYLYGFQDEDSLRRGERNEITTVHLSAKIFEVFVNGERQQSNSVQFVEEKIVLQENELIPTFSGDTLKIATETDEGTIFLLPPSYIPPVDTAHLKTQKLCHGAMGVISAIINKAVQWEAETGEYPNDLTELLKAYDMFLDEGPWKYDYSVRDYYVIVKATLNEGYDSGAITSGDYIMRKSTGEILYSNPKMKKLYFD